MSPLRLDYPINSGADDFNFTIDPKFVKKDSLLNRAVFSSNRNYKNGDDIYEFIKIQKAQPPIERKFKLKVFATFSYFKTLEYSANQKEETLDSIVINMDKQDGTIFTNNKSKISLQLSPGDSFEIQSGRRGYLNYRMNIVTPMISNLQQDSTINLEYKIKLVPFEFNKEFLLQDVYYDFDKSEIREDAMSSLKKLFELLSSNPKIKVLIISHTDCRGDEDYNQVLSESRAKSVVNYLVSKGIDPTILSYKGYGEKENIINCVCANCTEEEHQFNRRSTFTLIK